MSERGPVYEADTSGIGGSLDVRRRPGRGRRVWRQVLGISGARVVEKDARAELFCRCGRLVILGVWDAVEKCECGRWYSLVCVVKEEVIGDAE